MANVTALNETLEEVSTDNETITLFFRIDDTYAAHFAALVHPWTVTVLFAVFYATSIRALHAVAHAPGPPSLILLPIYQQLITAISGMFLGNTLPPAKRNGTFLHKTMHSLRASRGRDRQVVRVRESFGAERIFSSK